MIMQQAFNHNDQAQEIDSFNTFSTKDGIVKNTIFSHFRKSFPTSNENQGLPSNQLGIKIVSPTVFTQALEEVKPSKWVVSTL